MKFDKSILREADIRGVYPKQINGDFAYQLGLSFALFLDNRKVKYCVVGHDNRFGGPELTKNLIEGLRDSGINVMYLGLVTTPMLNFASHKLGFEYGIMVTASHNPKDNNGFKLFGKDYLHCSHEELKEIYSYLETNIKLSNKEKGKIEYIDTSNEYVNYNKENLKFNKNLKVVIDCGNGTASIIAKKMYEKINCTPIFIYSDSNPNFPNHHPDPNVKENLADLVLAVKKNKASLGIAYDGDCDRVGIVDDKGNIIDADILMAIMCEYLLKDIKNKDILIDVKCSKSLEDKIKSMGGNIIIETPSSAHQERVIKEKDIIFGGGYSNHIFIRDKHYGYDDGLYMGLRVQEMIANSDIMLSNMTKSITKYFHTDEIKVHVDDDKKNDIVKSVKEYCDNHNYCYSEIDGIKVFLNDGWALIRASNTGPNLTLRFEATTNSMLKKIQNEFMDVLGILDK